jgi:hypothetical protein
LINILYGLEKQRTLIALQSESKVIEKTLTIVTLIILLGISPINSSVKLNPMLVPDVVIKENYTISNITGKKIMYLYSSSYFFSPFFFFTSSKNKKLVHSSIRIEEEVVQSLQREAERQGISFNSLINKTLKNYVRSEMHFEQLGFLLVSKDFLRKTFAEMQDEKRLEELGTELGLTVAKEYVSYFFPKVDSSTVAEFLDIWFRRFQSFKHRVDDDNYNNNLRKEDKKEEEEENQGQRQEDHYFTLYHDINLNFSIALKAILEGLIEPIIKSPVTFKEITENSISFSFSLFSSDINNVNNKNNKKFNS